MRCGHLYYSGHNQCLLCVRSHMHDRMPRPVYGERHTLIQRRRSHYIIIRPSSLGGGRTLRRTLSVCLSVRLSVRPVSGCCFVILYSRIVLRANIQNRKNFCFRLWSNVTYVLFGTRRGPHIVRPSRPHKLVYDSYVGEENFVKHLTEHSKRRVAVFKNSNTIIRTKVVQSHLNTTFN